MFSFEAKMRDLVVCCGLVLATLGIALSQSSSPSTEFEGSVSGKTYTNPALGITWEIESLKSLSVMQSKNSSK
jgi:hypothetical protein